MPVLVDTTVWSLALRRRRKVLDPAERADLLRLGDLIDLNQAFLTDIVCYELLCGITSASLFQQTKEYLEELPRLSTGFDEMQLAAQCFTTCAQAGIATATADLLICAVAIANMLPVYTADRDFARYAKVLPVRLLSPEDVDELIDRASRGDLENE
jgi:predicted nucleic acid-binding protein